MFLAWMFFSVMVGAIVLTIVAAHNKQRTNYWASLAVSLSMAGVFMRFPASNPQPIWLAGIILIILWTLTLPMPSRKVNGNRFSMAYVWVLYVWTKLREKFSNKSGIPSIR